MAIARKLVWVVWVVSALVLSACGGGGGGDAGTGAGTPASGIGSGGGTGNGGTGGTGDPGTGPGSGFSAFGPQRVASAASSTHAPQVARLGGGRNVVAWVEGGQLMARFMDQAGTPAGDALAVHADATLGVGAFSVAPAADGGFVIAWVMETERPDTQFEAVTVLQARRYSAAGALVWEQRVNDGLLHSISSPVVKPAGNGSFVVGWTSRAVLPAPWQAFLQFLGADGSRTGAPVAVDTTGDPQEQLALAPLQDGSVLAVWRRVVFGSRGGAHWIYARRFSAAGAPMTEPAAVSPPFILPATQPFSLDADTLANGNVGLVWGGPDPTGAHQVHAAVLTPDGALASAATTTAATWPVSGVALVPLGSQGFGAAWQEVRGGSREVTAMLRIRRFDNAGTPSGEGELLNERLTYWVSPTTGFFVDAGTGFDLYGGADGHFIGAYHRAESQQANTYLFGQ